MKETIRQLGDKGKFYEALLLAEEYIEELEQRVKIFKKFGETLEKALLRLDKEVKNDL